MLFTLNSGNSTLPGDVAACEKVRLFWRVMVPEKVELHKVPNVKYEYTVIDNRTVVVDPETHTIVKVLD